MKVKHLLFFILMSSRVSCAKCKSSYLKDSVSCSTCNRVLHPGCVKYFIKLRGTPDCCRVNLPKLPEVINWKPVQKNKKESLGRINQLRLANQAISEDFLSINQVQSHSLQSETMFANGAQNLSSQLQSTPLLSQIVQPSQVSQVQVQPQQMYTTQSQQTPQLPPDWAGLDVSQKLDRLMLRLLTSDQSTNARLDSLVDSFHSQGAELTQLKEENANLRREIDDVKTLVSSPPKAQLKISGIPAAVTLDERAIYSAVLNKLGIPNFANSVLSARKIKFKETQAARDPSKAPTQAIIVEFMSAQIRDHVVGVARAHGELFSEEVFLGVPSQGVRIFCHEFLAQPTNDLFRKTKEKARSANFKFTWTKNGSIFTRKDNNSDIIRILTEQDLEKII